MPTFSIAHLMALISGYHYLILFPLVVIEGPIITILAGFLVSSGYLHGFTAYWVIVAGDLTGDALHYGVGRLARHHRATRILNFLRITPARLETVEQHFIKHPGKTLLLGKIAHGIGGIPLVAAGVAKMPFYKFMAFNTIATLPKSLTLLVIGYLFGQYIYQIDKYLKTGTWLVLGGAILLVAIYVLVVKLATKSYKK